MPVSGLCRAGTTAATVSSWADSEQGGAARSHRRSAMPYCPALAGPGSRAGRLRLAFAARPAAGTGAATDSETGSESPADSDRSPGPQAVRRRYRDPNRDRRRVGGGPRDSDTRAKVTSAARAGPLSVRKRPAGADLKTRGPGRPARPPHAGRHPAIRLIGARSHAPP